LIERKDGKDKIKMLYIKKIMSKEGKREEKYNKNIKTKSK